MTPIWKQFFFGKTMPVWETHCCRNWERSSSKSIESATRASQNHHAKRRCSTPAGAMLDHPCMSEDHQSCHARLCEGRSLAQSFECPHAQASWTCWTCRGTPSCHSLKHAGGWSGTWSLPPKFPVCWPRVCQTHGQMFTLYMYIHVCAHDHANDRTRAMNAYHYACTSQQSLVGHMR